MSTLSKNWAAAVELHVTDAFGGTDADLAGDKAYDYTGDVDLETSGHEGAQVFVETKLNFGARTSIGEPAGASDIIIDVFASLDGSAYDSEPYARYRIKNYPDTDWRSITFIVKDLAHFRIGLKTTETTDSYDYRITHQRWNIDDS